MRTQMKKKRGTRAQAREAAVKRVRRPIRNPNAAAPEDELIMTEDAASYLGVGVKTIGYLHWKYLNPEKAREDQIPAWMPDPVRGSRWTESGVYRKVDIQELDALLDAAPALVKRRRRRRRSKK